MIYTLHQTFAPSESTDCAHRAHRLVIFGEVPEAITVPDYIQSMEGGWDPVGLYGQSPAHDIAVILLCII